ncbi:MAG TPA: APC family permease [Pyrinomonadaceae bacterium]|nr:APC family permease [Pyrinomonadaceae bacterium]
MQPNDAATLTTQRGQLWRVLGVGFGLAVIIGNTIGAGIFRAPGTIAAQLPNPWLFLGVWVIGGLYALLGAISLAELGTLIPRSGGQYVYSRYALGEYAGFIVGWSDWISSCGSTATVSLLIGEFSGALVPPLAGKGPIVAATVAIVFAMLQWRGILWGSNIQNLTSLLKALAFVALIAAGFMLGGGGSFTTSETYSTPVGLALIVGVVISLREAIYTYDGWSGVIYFSEEVQNPARDIPRSLFGGVVTITAIYLLVNVALLYVLPISQIAGKEFAAGEAATVIFGAYGDTIFRCLTIVSMLSGINALHLMATRVIFGMSRDGLFTTKAAVVNDGGTPSVALWLSALVAVLFIIFGQTAGQVITIVAFFFVANYVLSFISLFVLRRREPEKPRPYRAWGYPWTTGLALVGSLLFLAGAVASDTRNSVYALLLLAVSYPVFRLIKWFS